MRGTEKSPKTGSDDTGNPVHARLLTANEVAELLALPVTWVYAETRADRIPHVSLGKYRRYRLEAIERWLEEQERGA